MANDCIFSNEGAMLRLRTFLASWREHVQKVNLSFDRQCHVLSKGRPYIGAEMAWHRMCLRKRSTMKP